MGRGGECVRFQSSLQARLRDKHQELLRKKLFYLKQQQLTQGGSEAPPLFPAGSDEQGEGSGGVEVKEEVKEEEEEEEDVAGPSGMATGEEPDTLIDEQDLLKRAYEDYESGEYSPKLIKFTDVEEVSGRWSSPFVGNPFLPWEPFPSCRIKWLVWMRMSQ